MMAGTAFGVDQAADFLSSRGFTPPLAVSVLRGGYWNQVMKIVTPKGSLVLKRYVDVLPNSLFPNLPEAEAAALQRLNGLGVAPERMGFWPEDKILV